MITVNKPWTMTNTINKTGHDIRWDGFYLSNKLQVSGGKPIIRIHIARGTNTHIMAGFGKQ